MTTLAQQITVLSAVLGAAVYIPIYFLRRRKLKAGCKSCPALKDFQHKTVDAGKSSSV